MHIINWTYTHTFKTYIYNSSLTHTIVAEFFLCLSQIFDMIRYKLLLIIFSIPWSPRTSSLFILWADAALEEVDQFLFHFWRQLCGRCLSRYDFWVFKHFADDLFVFVNKALDWVDSVLPYMLSGSWQHRSWQEQARCWCWGLCWRLYRRLLLWWSHSNRFETWRVHLALQECQNLLFCHLRWL